MGWLGGLLLAGNLIGTAVQNAKTKKEIQTIYQQVADTNYDNRMVMALPGIDTKQLLLTSGDNDDNDILVYEYTGTTPAINYIWGENSSPEGLVTSGANQSARVRAMMPFVRKSQIEEIPVIALHSGNVELETMITENSRCCECINKNKLYYDVFRGMPVDDMATLLYETMPEDDASPNAEALFRALLEVVLRTNGTVTFQNLAAFPISDISVKLNSMLSSGEITADEHREIDGFYKSGSSELNAVRVFLNKLNRQAEGIYGRPTSNVCNIKKMLNLKGAIAIDVGASGNDLFFSLAMNHIMLLQSQGREFSIILDGIPISRFPKATDLLRGRTYAISHNDFVSSLSGGEIKGDDLFTEICGNVQTLVLLKHSSNTSCQKWSDHLGTYHKYKIKYNISQSNAMINSNTSRGIQVDEADEPRVRAQTLEKLIGDMACIHSAEGTLFAEV